MTGALRFLALDAIGAGVLSLAYHHHDLCAAFCAVGTLLVCWVEIINLRHERDVFRWILEAVERQLTRTRNRA